MARGSVRKRSFVKAGKRSGNGLLLGYEKASRTGAEMVQLYSVSAPTVSRIVAAHRMRQL